MKQTVMFMLLLLTYVESIGNNDNFYPRLPLGEYQIRMKNVLPCNPAKQNEIKINIQINKISSNDSDIRGNFSLNRPFDDNLSFQVILDQKSSNGGWAVNSFTFNKELACSTFAAHIGQTYKKMLGWVEPYKCPMLPGTYIVNGYPATHMEKTFLNIPKVFFYGTYRFRFIILDTNKKEVGCLHAVIEIKRPWEMS